mmetsp:Transcript_61685/g.173950  ORF Transcript_61685/g.173950 Transcript_61685/m.173950 type:complete len:172 (+) Transcript_61685:129-644(+)
MPPKSKKPKRTNKPSPLERMQEAFALVNLDTDKCISSDEFCKAMDGIGITKDVAIQLFNRFDPDGNGQLDTDEFFAYAAKGSGEVRSLLKRGIPEEDEGLDRVVEAFKAWDKDGDGTITRAELEQVLIVLNPSFTKKDLNTLMKSIDKNKDGVIDYEEFADWLVAPPAKKR